MYLCQMQWMCFERVTRGFTFLFVAWQLNTPFSFSCESTRGASRSLWVFSRLCWDLARWWVQSETWMWGYQQFTPWMQLASPGGFNTLNKIPQAVSQPHSRNSNLMGGCGTCWWYMFFQCLGGSECSQGQKPPFQSNPPYFTSCVPLATALNALNTFSSTHLLPPSPLLPAGWVLGGWFSVCGCWGCFRVGNRYV